ncbi:sperm protein associated with the nucleus on the X chromosome N2 isoform X2 [Vulpes vulpes]|uniref:Sperm protein associated with the nucleus on the X chromosome N2 isoform X2 n=1 Tax=Vulpes vulpes TaxID=9627 RepID=A0ABM4ZBY8_VULVU
MPKSASGTCKEPPFCDPYLVRKILAKVKSALQDNVEKRKKGRKSTILVCYRRHSKMKTENQLKMKTEEESLSPLWATPYACQGPKISK